MHTTQPSLRPTNEQRAMEYCKHAAEFTDAYSKLSKADANLQPAAKDLQQPSAKLLIIGHALELVLKGWLVLKEGSRVSITGAQRRALEKTGQTVPITLKDYGHDLQRLATATVPYYPALQAFLDKLPVLDADKNPVLDKGGNPKTVALIEHLNASYWAGGARAYEYPEGDAELQGDEQMSILTPLDSFANFVKTCRHELLNAIISQNGGSVPSQFIKASAPASKSQP